MQLKQRPPSELFSLQNEWHIKIHPLIKISIIGASKRAASIDSTSIDWVINFRQNGQCILIHQSESWVIRLYGPYKRVFSIVSIHHLDCNNSHARVPLCLFGVNSKESFPKSLNFYHRHLLHGKQSFPTMCLCSVILDMLKCHMDLTTIPEFLRGMTPLSWF